MTCNEQYYALGQQNLSRLLADNKIKGKSGLLPTIQSKFLNK